MSEIPPPRVKVLKDAIKLTVGERKNTYGPFVENMRHLAALIQAYYGTINVSPHDAAVILALSKISRIANSNQYHRDNYVDAANYLAAAWECAVVGEAVNDG